MKKTYLILTLTVFSTSIAYCWFGKSKAEKEREIKLEAQDTAQFYQDYSYVSSELYNRDIEILDKIIATNESLQKRILAQIKNDKVNKKSKSKHRLFLEETMLHFLNEQIVSDKETLIELKQIREPMFDCVEVGIFPFQQSVELERYK